MAGKRLKLSASILAVLAAVELIYYLRLIGLTAASKLASVMALFVAIAGLAVAAFRRANQQSNTAFWDNKQLVIPLLITLAAPAYAFPIWKEFRPRAERRPETKPIVATSTPTTTQAPRGKKLLPTKPAKTPEKRPPRAGGRDLTVPNPSGRADSQTYALLSRATGLSLALPRTGELEHFVAFSYYQQDNHRFRTGGQHPEHPGYWQLHLVSTGDCLAHYYGEVVNAACKDDAGFWWRVKPDGRRSFFIKSLFDGKVMCPNGSEGTQVKIIGANPSCRMHSVEYA